MRYLYPVLITLLIIALVVIASLGAFLVATQLSKEKSSYQSNQEKNSYQNNQEISLLAIQVYTLKQENIKLKNELQTNKFEYSNDYGNDRYYGDNRICLRLEDEEEDLEDDLDDTEDEISDLEAEIILKRSQNETTIHLEEELADLENEREDIEDDLDDVRDDQKRFRCYKNVLYL